jgi:small-conductance mechanosensitive channel
MEETVPPPTDWIQSLNQIVPPVIYAPALALGWILVLWLAKRFVVYRLKKWARTTSVRWDDVVIDAISFPANFLIFASGLTLLINLLPLPEKADKVMTIILQASVVFAIVFFIDRLVQGLMRTYSSSAIFSRASGGITKGLTRGFIMGLGILIFLDLIGISITPILASLGIGSLAVALALQDTLSNFFAGIHVSVDKPLELGQFVKLESGEEGYVIDIGWRTTRIRTPVNNVVIVPNSKLVNSVLTNYDLPDTQQTVLIQMGVHYDSDLNHVERVVCEIGKEMMKTLDAGVPDFEPLVRYHTFADSSINFAVVLRTKVFTEQHLIKHEFIKRLHERFKKEGIVIPYPIRTVEILKEAKNSL